MTTYRIRILLLLGLVIISGISCGETPQPVKKKSLKERITPVKDASFAEQMNIAESNLDLMVYGFINYDITQITQAADNITTLSQQWIRKPRGADVVNEAELGQYCDKQIEIVKEIRGLFEEKNFLEANKSCTKLLKCCMDCHIQYLK